MWRTFRLSVSRGGEDDGEGNFLDYIYIWLTSRGLREMVDEVVRPGRKGLDVVRLGKKGLVFIRNANRCYVGSTRCRVVVVSISATEARYV